MIFRWIIYLLPLWLVKKLAKGLPPTGSFRTTLGRVFRLIKIDDDTCIAISSEQYDRDTIEKLLEMKKQGEQLIDTAVSGINLLSYENRQDTVRKMAKNNRLD